MKFLEGTSKVQILLINNDRLVQKSLYEMLSRHDYKVDIAPSTDVALERLGKKNFDIVLHFFGCEFAANQPLDTKYRVFRVGDGLSFCHLSQEPFTTFGESNCRWGSTAPFGIG